MENIQSRLPQGKYPAPKGIILCMNGSCSPLSKLSRKFRPYLHGTRFVIKTDHNYRCYLDTKTNLSKRQMCLLQNCCLCRKEVKGCWEGSKPLDHLGFHIDTARLVFRIPETRLLKIQEIAKLLLNEPLRNRRLIDTNFYASSTAFTSQRSWRCCYPYFTLGLSTTLSRPGPSCPDYPIRGSGT